MELQAILEIGPQKSTRLESNLIGESIDRVNVIIGVLIRKKFQLINLESVDLMLKRDISIIYGFLQIKILSKEIVQFRLIVTYEI